MVMNNKSMKVFFDLYEKAVEKYGDDITPPGNQTWMTSINEYGLWVNDRQGSTHLIRG
jgi:hypothetical protein